MGAIRDMDPEELWDKLTDPNVESDEYEDLISVLQPFLSSSQMLTNRDSSTYSDWARGLLNKNKSERIVIGREYGEACTGPFRAIAQEEDGLIGPGGEPNAEWSMMEKEAASESMTTVKTDREALGDGTFLEKIADIHVSTHTSREGDPDAGDSRSGLKSLIPGM